MAIVADQALPGGARDTTLVQYGSNRDNAYIPLVYGSTVSVDASKGKAFSLTLTGNPTIANPTGLRAGDWLFMRLKQDAVGGRNPTWGSAYKWPNGITPSLSVTANMVDHVSGFVQDNGTVEMNIVRGY